MLAPVLSAAWRTGFILLVLAAPAPARAEAGDAVYQLDSITVAARRVTFGTTAELSSREDLNRSLQRLGIQMVRRGVPLASDLYADGFKRSDISVVVDDERYHCACPNRMDPPTSLAIPIELESATWEEASGSIGAGLAGRLSLRREQPSREWRVRGGAEGDLLHSRDASASFAVEGAGQRLSARAMAGESYDDGGGSSFGDRYGYRDEDVRYRQADLAWRGTRGRAALGVQGSVTRDVPYAYLQMDERENDLWNASLAFGGAKVYVNHARHLMDNGLRVSTMGMSTTANQTTVGLLGRAGGAELEAWGREWDARNTIATPMHRTENHLLPLYRQWSASAARRITAGALRVSARLGLTQAGIGDESVLPVYRVLHPDAEASRWFVPFALGATRTFDEAAHWSAMAEVVAEPPTAEQLYVTVHRPMMPGTPKPDWTGAPTLNAPLRASLRGQWSERPATLELGGSWVSGYVLPQSATAGAARYVTYGNVDAALLTGRASGRLPRTDWSLSYTLGWNLTAHSALAEIAPFMAQATARPPLFGTLEGLVRIETAAAQDRVDESLAETRTVAWGQLDVGLRWLANPVTVVTFEVLNVTDALYGEHLSYLRDPFASGLRVMAPGRTARLAVAVGD